MIASATELEHCPQMLLWSPLKVALEYPIL